MSTNSEEHGFLHLPHRKKGARDERDTPGVDQVVEISESHVPWDDDAPIVREDEHYELLSEDKDFPSERAIDPRLLPDD